MQARIPVETLPEPKTILGLDGEVLTRITQQTQTITLIVSRNHREKFCLFLIPVSSSPGVSQGSLAGVPQPTTWAQPSVNSAHSPFRPITHTTVPLTYSPACPMCAGKVLPPAACWTSPAPGDALMPMVAHRGGLRHWLPSL